MDRVIVLSTPADAHAVSVREQWNQQPRQPHAEILMSRAGASFAYDAVIADVARHVDGQVARSDSRNFMYPVDPAIVGSTTWTPRLILLPLSVVLLGLPIYRAQGGFSYTL